MDIESVRLKESEPSSMGSEYPQMVDEAICTYLFPADVRHRREVYRLL
jgi:hypothetical protein